MTASRLVLPASSWSRSPKRMVRTSLPSPSRRGWSPGISAPRWNMMLTRVLEGLKLAMLPLYAKVGVFHLMDSVTRPSAPRMTSRACRITASRGCSASSNHRRRRGPALDPPQRRDRRRPVRGARPAPAAGVHLRLGGQPHGSAAREHHRRNRPGRGGRCDDTAVGPPWSASRDHGGPPAGMGVLPRRAARHLVGGMSRTWPLLDPAAVCSGRHSAELLSPLHGALYPMALAASAAADRGTAAVALPPADQRGWLAGGRGGAGGAGAGGVRPRAARPCRGGHGRRRRGRALARRAAHARAGRTLAGPGPPLLLVGAARCTSDCSWPWWSCGAGGTRSCGSSPRTSRAAS